MDQYIYLITFDNASTADANQYSEELKDFVLEAVPDAQVQRKRSDPRTQDWGAIIEIVLGSTSVVALAKAVSISNPAFCKGLSQPEKAHQQGRANRRRRETERDSKEKRPLGQGIVAPLHALSTSLLFLQWDFTSLSVQKADFDMLTPNPDFGDVLEWHSTHR